MTAGLSVAALYVHPVKSGRAVAAREVEVHATGFEHDRAFMVVDARGEFLTQREHPELARLDATIEGGALRLAYGQLAPLRVPIGAPGAVRDVVVWGDRVAAVDLGDEAASYVAALLGRPARLVRMADDARRPVDTRYGRSDDEVSFADGFPVLVATSAALDAVNEGLARAVDQRRFRPNLVVAGAEPFEEDLWSELAIGDVRLALVKPCSRCPIVDVDPDRGERDPGVLTRLAVIRASRNRVYYGQNAIPRALGRIRVGDPVVVLARRG